MARSEIRTRHLKVTSPTLYHYTTYTYTYTTLRRQQTLNDCTNVHSRMRMVYPWRSSLMSRAARNSRRNPRLMMKPACNHDDDNIPHVGRLLTHLIPQSHSYCLSLPLCLEWYNGSIRVHSGMTKRIECRLYYRPSATVE